MPPAKSWIEINSQNLLHNYQQFKNRVGGGVKVCAVVKANAYGHGLTEVVTVLKNSADYFAVDSLAEAIEIRKICNKEVLILGYTLLSELNKIVEQDFQQTIVNMESLVILGDLAKIKGKKVRIHLKVETGTSRQGVFLSELNNFFNFIKGNKNLELAGISTHFANIEDTTDHSFSIQQKEKYNQAVELAKSFGFKNFLRHNACSAAIVLFEDTHNDLVRLGISLYGHWSSETTFVSARQMGLKIDLRPVLSFKTVVAQIKTLPSGSTISYGCTEKVLQPTKVAILPIGYYDGFDRKFSSLGKVLINGQFCRVLGRVCMNMIVVDVNHLPNIKLEDEVVIVGEQFLEKISVENLASSLGTINYEILARLNPLIKKVIV